jgi:hypothetical protein
MPINNRGLAGQPSLPYTDFRSYAGADVNLNFTFLDNNGNLLTPTTITYFMDDITNFINMIPLTSLTPTGSQQTLNIQGSVLQMTFDYQGSQICQLVVTATFFNALSGITTTARATAIIELVAIQVVNTQ